MRTSRIHITGEDGMPQTAFQGKICEFRIPFPISKQEYLVSHRYTIAKASLHATNAGDGVTVLQDDDGYSHEVHGPGNRTLKHYHMGKNVAGMLATVLPASMILVEEAVQCASWGLTKYSCPFFGERFHASIETIVMEDDGTAENIFELSASDLTKRTVVDIDIGSAECSDPLWKDFKPSEVKSEKTGRGPLTQGWQNEKPLVYIYKIVKLYFKVLGLQTIVESKGIQRCQEVITAGHRFNFCIIDEWFGKTIEDVVAFEKDAAEKLKERTNHRG